MRIEVERRFLVTDSSLLNGQTGNLIVQGYLFSNNGFAVRVRRTHWSDEGNRRREGPAMLAAKGPRVKGARVEYEFEIDSDFASGLLRQTPMKVTKIRYQLIEDGWTWDVDVFHGDNEGLVIAECEGAGVFSMRPPSWCGEEITDDSRYNNENLAANPYNNWSLMAE